MNAASVNYLLSRLRFEKKGQDLVEYALMAAGIAVAAGAIFRQTFVVICADPGCLPPAFAVWPLAVWDSLTRPRSAESWLKTKAGVQIRTIE